MKDDLLKVVKTLGLTFLEGGLDAFRLIFRAAGSRTLLAI